MSSDILTVEEACRMVGCAEQTLLARLRSGNLPGLKLGKSWVIPQAAFVSRLNELAAVEAERRKKPVVQKQSNRRRRPLLTL